MRAPTHADRLITKRYARPKRRPIKPTTRRRLISASWTISSHLAALAILAALTFDLRGYGPLILLASAAPEHDWSDAPITLAAEPVEEEPPEEEEDPPEEEPEDEPEQEPVAQPEEAPPVPEPTPIEPAAPAPVVSPVPLPTPTPARRPLLRPRRQARRLQDLATDAARLAETERRVAAAGGLLDAPVRVSLSFSGDDDIDLHVQYEGGNPYYNRRRSQRGVLRRVSGYVWYRSPHDHFAALDVDANAVHTHISPNPCENIVFTTPPRSGRYLVRIHHFRSRGPFETTPYVVVVRYGSKRRVYNGLISPREEKVITRFRYNPPR